MSVRRLHRANALNLFLIAALLLGTLVPPKAYAPPEPEIPQAYDQNSAVIVLQDADTVESVTDALMHEARRLGTRRISAHHVIGRVPEHRLAAIVGRLRGQGFEVTLSEARLSEFNDLLDRANATPIIPETVNRMAAERAREDADRASQRPTTWLRRVLSVPGQLMNLGGMLLSLPRRILSAFTTRMYNQPFQSLGTFLVERDARNPDEFRVRSSNSMMRNALATAGFAVAWIFVTAFGIAPLIVPDAPTFAGLSERAFQEMVQISGLVFVWVFAFLCIPGQVAAWKDQILRLEIDRNAPEGRRVRLVPREGVNFAATLWLESLLCAILGLFPLTLATIRDGVTEMTGAALLGVLFYAVYNGFFSVLAYRDPSNWLGRWWNRISENLQSDNPAVREKAERERDWFTAICFSFWSFGFSTVANLSRFLPGFVAKIPLIAMGALFTGGKLLSKLFLRRAEAATPPSPELLSAPVEEPKASCTMFMLHRPPAPI